MTLRVAGNKNQGERAEKAETQFYGKQPTHTRTKRCQELKSNNKS